MEEPERMTHEQVLRARLEALQSEHRDLDEAIAALDQLRLRRLKKRKLSLKDQIAAIEDELFPDIIA